MKIEFQVQNKISRPIAEVFDAVVNPKKLTGYFVSAASAPLKEGTTVTWEFEGFGAFPVIVGKIVPNKSISLEWDGSGDGYQTQIEMIFEEIDKNTTMVKIAERGWRDDDNGVKRSYDNCGGWMHMLCCLKAYIEYDINLRKGSV